MNEDIPLSEHISELRHFIKMYATNPKKREEMLEHLNALDLAYKAKGAV